LKLVRHHPGFDIGYTHSNKQNNVQPDVHIQPDVAFLDEIKITGETVKKNWIV